MWEIKRKLGATKSYTFVHGIFASLLKRLMTFVHMRNDA
jgi:hypothetical protein